MSSVPTPTYAGFARLYWMFIGPMLSALIAYRIVMQSEDRLTVTDVVYLLCVGALLLARWAEFRGGDPQTAEGDPATRDHLRRYVLLIPCIGVAVWIVAHLLREYLAR